MQRRRVGMLKTMRLWGLMAGGLWLLAAGQAQAVSGNGPYYAEPSWDQKLDAATRFVVLSNWNNEAVLDQETGLVWERSPQMTVLTWSSARSICANRTVGNRKGWRLPSFPELASLIDPTQYAPALPPGHPFVLVLHPYWSASTIAGTPAGAWVVGFINGVVITGDKTDSSHVWCVRGGMNADAY